MMVTIIEEEILLSDLVSRLGLAVEVPGSVSEALFCVSVREQPAQTVLKMVASAGAMKLEETRSGWRLSARPSVPTESGDSAYDSWISPYRRMPSGLAAERREAKLSELIRKEISERLNGWQDRLAALNLELGRLEELRQQPGLRALTQLRQRLPIGVTTVLSRDPISVARRTPNGVTVASTEAEWAIEFSSPMVAGLAMELPEARIQGAGRASKRASEGFLAVAEAVNRPLVVRTFRETRTGVFPDRLSVLTSSLWDFSLRDESGWLLGLSQRLKSGERAFPFRELKRLEAASPFLALEDAITLAKLPLDDTPDDFWSPTLSQVREAAPALRVVSLLPTFLKERLLAQEPIPLTELPVEARLLAWRAVTQDAAPLKLGQLIAALGALPEPSDAWAFHLYQVASPRKVKTQLGTQVVADFAKEGDGWEPALIREYAFRIGLDTKRSMTFPMTLIEPMP